MSQECCNAVLHKKLPSRIVSFNTLALRHFNFLVYKYMNESFAFSQFFFIYIIIIDSIGSLVSVNDDSVVICSGLRDSWVRWIGRRRAAGGEFRKREHENKTGGNWGEEGVFPTTWGPRTGYMDSDLLTRINIVRNGGVCRNERLLSSNSFHPSG